MKIHFTNPFIDAPKEAFPDRRPLLIFVSFLYLAAWSWKRSGDLIVDFGRELYVPWQITLGRNLGTDILCVHGPFSKYFNALLFSLFGVSFTTLIVFNLFILWLITMMLYRIFSVAGDKNNAAIICLFFLGLFGFSHNQVVGNYNFITPYCHEAVHGSFFCVVILYSLMNYWEKRSFTVLIPAGICLGLSFLTKPEIAVSAAAVCVFSGFLLWFREKNFKKTLLFLSLLFLLAVLAIAFFCESLLIFTKMAPKEIFSLLLSPWQFSLVTKPVARYFYSNVLGFNKSFLNITNSVLVCAYAVLFLMLVKIIAGKFQTKRSLARLNFLLLALIIANESALLEWYGIFRGLNIFAVSLFIFYSVKFFKNRDQTASKEAFVLLNLSFFSIFFLLKIILKTKITHYGFYLAFPATLLSIYFLLHTFPSLNARTISKRKTWALIVAFLIGGFIFFIQRSELFYGGKTYPIGKGRDLIYAYNSPAPGILFEKTRRRLKKIMREEDTLAVLPEGELLNYLLRKNNPAAFDHLAPIEIDIFGEERILESLKKSKPDFIVLIHRNSREYSLYFFGRDPRFGKKIMAWINQNYIFVETAGDRPFTSRKNFGITILSRMAD